MKSIILLTLRFYLYSSIERISFLSNEKSILNIPSFPYSDTIKKLSHFHFKEWGKIVSNVSKSYHDSGKYLIE